MSPPLRKEWSKLKKHMKFVVVALAVSTLSLALAAAPVQAPQRRQLQWRKKKHPHRRAGGEWCPRTIGGRGLW